MSESCDMITCVVSPRMPLYVCVIKTLFDAPAVRENHANYVSEVLALFSRAALYVAPHKSWYRDKRARYQSRSTVRIILVEVRLLLLSWISFVQFCFQLLSGAEKNFLQKLFVLIHINIAIRHIFYLFFFLWVLCLILFKFVKLS